ncbi:hypothetical protein LINGRAHAP2_LOCUS24564, partial [Linum grandiflorum]
RQSSFSFSLHQSPSPHSLVFIHHKVASQWLLLILFLINLSLWLLLLRFSATIGSSNF